MTTRQTSLEKRRKGEISQEARNRFNRSRLEITSSILLLCSERKKKTHIMYGANLSHRQLCVYLDFLTSTGLIAVETIGEATLYATTTKVSSFLKDIKRIEPLLQKIKGNNNKPQYEHKSIHPHEHY